MKKMTAEEKVQIRAVMKRWSYATYHTRNTNPAYQVRLPVTRFGSLDYKPMEETEDLMGFGETEEQAFQAAYEEFVRRRDEA